MKVVTMEVGASDYLANGLQQEFADAVVDRFSELSAVIKKWHDEAKEAAIELSETAAVTTAENVQPATDAPPSVASGQQGSKTAKTKFCMFCGESVPNAAKFCPHCGEKQEV